MSIVIEKCNLCQKGKETENEKFILFFANCGHLICNACRTDSIQTCPICKKVTNYAKIDELTNNLKLYFQDPSHMIKMYGKVVEFQYMQHGIVQKFMDKHIENLENQKILLNDQLKSKDKEIKYLKAKCSELEHEIDKRNQQIKALVNVDDDAQCKQKIIDENKYVNDFKVDETKSIFFDMNEINKQANEKKSPYQTNLINSGLASISPSKPNRQNKKSKITYSNLEYFLK